MDNSLLNYQELGQNLSNIERVKEKLKEMQDIDNRDEAKKYMLDINHQLKENIKKNKLDEPIEKELDSLKSIIKKRFRFLLTKRGKESVDKFINKQMENVDQLLINKIKYYNLKQIEELENLDIKENKEWCLGEIEQKIKVNDKLKGDKFHNELNELSLDEIKNILIAIKIVESEKYDIKHKFDKDYLNQDEATKTMELVEWSLDVKDNHKSKLEKSETKPKENKGIFARIFNFIKSKYNKLKGLIKFRRANHLWGFFGVSKIFRIDGLSSYMTSLNMKTDTGKLLQDKKIRKIADYAGKTVKEEEKVREIFEKYNLDNLCEKYQQTREVDVLDRINEQSKVLVNIVKYENEKYKELGAKTEELKKEKNSLDNNLINSNLGELEVKELMGKVQNLQNSIKELEEEFKECERTLLKRTDNVKRIRGWLLGIVKDEDRKSVAFEKLDNINSVLREIDDQGEIVDDKNKEVDNQDVKSILDEVYEEVNKIDKISREDSQATLVNEEDSSISRENSSDTLVNNKIDKKELELLKEEVKENQYILKNKD